MLYFNADDGYLEGIVRGYRSGLLTTTQYMNLTQCESLDDMKMQLAATDYGNFLANEPPPLTTSVFFSKLSDKLVADFAYIRANAVGKLTKFLDYLTYAYMIDNVILIITGTLHQRDPSELLDKCHPLGVFEAMPALTVATTVQDLYTVALVETPLGPYFKNCLNSHDLDELNIEIIRNSLYKAYLEDFYQFCTNELDGETGEVMKRILQFEADRRVINITINSFGTELSKDDRAKLFPTCGQLYPDGTARLAKVDDLDAVKLVLEGYPDYRHLFDSTDNKTLEDRFFEREVFLNKLSFMSQFHYGVFYSFLRLREQEVRNIVWIAECVAQGQRDRINNYVSIF
ncbi:ATP synthase subunit [Catenaria anguillulae PL171]|uniref:V-type proton ATPase subunit n=1 Tax=Catenaria anguillulae PL171 TaxID=765915 RepID=A0A1Y2HKS5_9FUNG|nr:ATP synthase subunit [Catenaria anguillulae PL171]ORZ33867.1 ATP synthase subunit [Catenaria anguillulae PL171]